LLKITKLGAYQQTGSLSVLSAGRIVLLQDGWSVFLIHPLLGVGNYYTENFQLSSLDNFGIIGGGLLILISMIPVYHFAIKQFFTRDRITYVTSLLGILFLVDSIFEAESPFGPGVRCFILWLLIGYAYGREGMNRKLEPSKL